MSSHAKQLIGAILLRQQAVSPRQLEGALRSRRRGDPPLASMLTEMGVISETEALKALSEQSGCPAIDLNQVCIRLVDLRFIPRELAERHYVLPVLVKGNRMFVAMTDPTDQRLLQELEMVSGKRAFPYISLKATLRRIIADAYTGRDAGEKHYVGSTCPPETLRKAGIKLRAGQAKQQSSHPQPSSRAQSSSSTPPRRMVGTLDEAPSVQFEKRLRPSYPAMRIQVQDTAVLVNDAFANAAPSEHQTLLEEPSISEINRALSRPPVPQPQSERQIMLVVDPDERTRALIAGVFRERGYRVLEADRGDTALQMVRDHRPDVAILEATLPKVHGFQVTRELKRGERYGGVRIIMISELYRGWRFAQDLKNNYGVDEFVEKPLDIDELVHAVEKAQREGPPRSVRVSEEARPHIEAGVAAYRDGKLEVALEHLQAGKEADPLDVKVRFHLGLLYGKMGKIYDAIQELETALSIHADYFPALKNLGVLYQNAGFRNKAIEMWERCLANAPDEATRQKIKEMLVAVL